MIPVSVVFRFKGRGLERTIAALSQSKVLPTMKRIADHLLVSVRQNIDSNGQGKWPAYSPKYGARKAAGRTPGGAKFGMTMLKDSGRLYDSLRAVADMGPRGPRAYVFAEGNRPKGPSNQELLRLHFAGAGRLPRRSAIMPSDLKSFALFAQAELERYLTRAKRG
jgi:hypothetical protein